MEGEFTPEQTDFESHPHTLSKRAEMMLELQLKPFISGYTVENIEALDSLPKDKEFIFVSPHLRDFDVPLSALVAGKKYPSKLTGHENLKGGVDAALGKDLYIPISSTYSEPSDVPYKAVEYLGEFDDKDYQPMIQAMDEGYAIIMAAHNPVYDGKLPEHAGVGPGYLALLNGKENTCIVPFGISVNSDKYIGRGSIMFKPQNIAHTVGNLFHRPKATVRIGQPIQMGNINQEDFNRFRDVIAKDPSARSREEVVFRRKFMLELEKANRPIMDTVLALSGVDTNKSTLSEE